MSTKIITVRGREIIDSRGNPTVEAEVGLEGGAIVLINHRMHEDDLTGMLRAQQAAGGDRWEVVELKPDMENGIALWPEKYPIEALERIRRNTTAQDWSALYLQSPTPDEGVYFKADWLRPYDKTPPRETMVVYGGSDYAVTDNGGDYTVHAVVGIDPEDRMYLLDIWRGQKQGDVWIDALCDLILEWKPMGWAEVIGSRDIFVGVNAVDYSGYPDCRPVFIEAFESLAQVATKAGVEGGRFKIHAPLIDMSKAEIIRTGAGLGVDFGSTVSCYQADAEGRACGKCDSCRLRAAGFAAANTPDPTRYS